jgi:hypothetical protein
MADQAGRVDPERDIAHRFHERIQAVGRRRMARILVRSCW